ncbi:hypothetical protein [Chitinimonas arctica]|nr:hypothetical protein [Chitinimonas arctica]
MRLSELVVQLKSLGPERETEFRQRLGGQASEYLEEYRFFVHEGDLRIASDVFNDEVNLLVTGNLIVDGVYQDGSGGGILIVAGSMWAKHVLSWSAMCIGGDLWVQGVILQYYNDWCFDCEGIVSTRLFMNMDKSCRLDSSKAMIESCDLDYCGDSWGESPEDALGIDDGDAETIIDHVYAAENAGRSPFCQPEVLPARDGAQQRRRVMHPDVTAEELARWAADFPLDVAARGTLPSGLESKLLAHPDSRVRQAVAAAPWLSEHGIQTLANDQDEWVRTALAGRGELPDQLLASLAGDGSAKVRAAVVYAHRDAGAEWLPALASDGDVSVRQAVATVPALSPELVAALLQDPDTLVRRRILKRQHVGEAVWRPLLDSPDTAIRNYLANAAASGEAPFGDAILVRQQALMQLIRDPEPSVRRNAAVGWLAPGFYDTHADAFAVDSESLVRTMFACRSRRSDLLAKLADDSDDSVRTTVAEHPLTPGATLLRMAKDADSDLVSTLLDNPALPADALDVLYRRFPGYCGETHPNTRFVLLLNKLPCKLLDEDEQRPTLAAYRQRWAAEPSAAEIEHCVRELLAKPSFQLQRALLPSRHYPPDLLDAYLVRYLRKRNKDYRYEMCEVAANPSLWEVTIRKIGAYLQQHADYELLKGLCRNAAVPAAVFAALALGLQDEHDRNKAAAAAWRWHGIADDELAPAAAGAFDGIDWLTMAVPALDIVETDDVESLIAQGNEQQVQGDFEAALACFEEALLELEGHADQAYRQLFSRYMVMHLCKELVYHQDDIEEERKAQLREKGIAMANTCLDGIARYAIMQFTPLGKMEMEAIRYAQNFLALDTLRHNGDDADALRAAQERIADALGYPLDPDEPGVHPADLLITLARLQVKLNEEDKVDPAIVYQALSAYPFDCEFGSLTGEALARLVEAQPDKVDYRVALGLLYRRTESPEAGIAAFSLALALMAERGQDEDKWTYTREEILNWRGDLYLDAGNHEAGLADLTEAISLDEDWPVAVAARGWAFYFNDQAEAGIADFQAALVLEPDNAAYLDGLSYCLMELARYEEAISCQEKLLAHERSAETLNSMAWALFQLGRLEQALTLVEEALGVDDTSAEAWDTKAEVLQQLGQLSAARECAQRAAMLAEASRKSE